MEASARLEATMEGTQATRLLWVGHCKGQAARANSQGVSALAPAATSGGSAMTSRLSTTQPLLSYAGHALAPDNA